MSWSPNPSWEGFNSREWIKCMSESNWEAIGSFSKVRTILNLPQRLPISFLPGDAQKPSLLLGYPLDIKVKPVPPCPPKLAPVGPLHPRPQLHRQPHPQLYLQRQFRWQSPSLQSCKFTLTLRWINLTSNRTSKSIVTIILSSKPEPVDASNVTSVQPLKHNLHIHKDNICYYSPFFDAAFNGNFQEGQTQTMEFDDVDVTAFGVLSGWLYSVHPKDYRSRRQIAGSYNAWKSLDSRWSISHSQTPEHGYGCDMW